MTDHEIRMHFPHLDASIPPHYLDSAAATLVPITVNDAMYEFYECSMANVHRSSHSPGNKATEAYESARHKVAQFILARRVDEVVFTRNTTESINLVAQAWGSKNLKSQDVILLTEMEHHSNIVPWQQIARQQRAQVKYVAVTNDGLLDLEDLKTKLKGAKILALTSCSNVLGTINPIKKICRWAHEQGVLVLVDAAQSMAFDQVNVQDWDCDFLAFSSHKMFGPFGAGVLWARYKHLVDMPPYQTGGAMIESVSQKKTKFLSPPQKFEAGTPNVAGAVGLAAAITWLQDVGFKDIRSTERSLISCTMRELRRIKGLRFIAPTKAEIVPDTPSAVSIGPVLSFVIDGYNAFDVAQIIDNYRVSVRAGHHCCQPLLKKLKLPAVIRASFSIYNNKRDIERLQFALQQAVEILK